MSSLFSDPPFRRGVTLLNREVIEYTTDAAYATAVPVAGTEIVGQVKVFRDVHASLGIKYSNELVYCVAARFKPNAASTTLTSADRGKAVVIRNTATNSNDMHSTVEFDDTWATNANVNAGQRVGYIDDYLSVTVRANDICWLVIKGPSLVAKTTDAAINAGALVTITGTSGLSVTAASVQTLTEAAPNTLNQRAMGVANGSFTVATSAFGLGSNAASGDAFVRAILYGVNWAI